MTVADARHLVDGSGSADASDAPESDAPHSLDVPESIGIHDPTGHDGAVDVPGDRGAGGWVDVCDLAVLTPDRGVAALVAGRAVAVFRCSPDDELHAVDNVDPFSGASVLSRGLVGSVGDRSTVASPVHKQRFDLRTGEHLDDPSIRLDVWAVRLVAGRVLVSVGPGPPVDG